MSDSIKNHPLAEAARFHDAETEEMGLIEAIEKLGLQFQPLLYVAEQRALRSVLVSTRPEMLKMSPRTFVLTTEEQTVMSYLLPSVLDGMLIGWRAKGIHDRR